MLTQTKVTVRYSETDMMGIVHHSRYFPLFEIARGEHLSQSGITYLECEKRGLLLPVIESGCRYLRPAFYLDELIVTADLSELTPAKARYDYEITNQKNETVAAGFTLHAFVDKDLKPMNVKRKMPDMWEIMQRIKEK